MMQALSHQHDEKRDCRPAHSFDQSSHGSFVQSPLPANDRGELVNHHRDNSARKIRGSSARPLAYTITNKELRDRSKKAMRDFAGEGPGAAKRIADALECSDKTAQNYLDGRNCPGGVHDARAMHAIPHYAAMKLELAAMEASLDPRLQQKMVEFHRFMSMYGEKLFGGGE